MLGSEQDGEIGVGVSRSVKLTQNSSVDVLQQQRDLEVSIAFAEILFYMQLYQSYLFSSPTQL